MGGKMFVALRDAWFARGRFAVMGLVVALVALLVVALSGLTAGLGAQSVSALRALPGECLGEAGADARSAAGDENALGHA